MQKISSVSGPSRFDLKNSKDSLLPTVEQDSVRNINAFSCFVT